MKYTKKFVEKRFFLVFKYKTSKMVIGLDEKDSQEVLTLIQILNSLLIFCAEKSKYLAKIFLKTCNL